MLGLVATVLGSGATAFKSRWLQPVLVLFPLPLVLAVEAARPTSRRLRAYVCTLVACGGLWLTLRAGEVWLAPHLGCYTRLHFPIAGLAAGLRAAGFARGTLITDETVLGGALRLHFPDSRVLLPRFPALAVPPPPAGATAVVWRPRSGLAPPAELAELLVARGHDDGRGPETGAATDVWSRPPLVLDVPWAGAPDGTYPVAVVLLPPGARAARR